MNLKLIIVFWLSATVTAFSQKSELKTPMVGNDRDSHGCIGSAGYTFSNITGQRNYYKELAL
jgi:hypothetical protein